MNIPTKQRDENYNTIISMIDKYVNGDRKENLLKLYSDYKEVIKETPASQRDYYHNSFVGGYADHVLRVIEFSFRVHKLYIDVGFDIDYTKEELFMVALNHDLGKIGDEDGRLYLYNTSEWHRKNQGKIYKTNEVLDYMETPDRSLYLLQKYNVDLTKNEYLGIRIHDGLYSKSNETYLISYNQENALKTLLPYVVHQADLMASKFENRRWMINKAMGDDKTTVSEAKKVHEVIGEERGKELTDLFKNSKD